MSKDISPARTVVMVTVAAAVIIGGCEWPADFEPRDVAQRPATATLPPLAGQPPGRVQSPVTTRVQPPVTTRVASVNDAELTGGLLLPVLGVKHAELRDTYTEMRGTRVHEAIDILAPRGTPVLSATDGRLLKIFNSKAGGLMLYATDASERFILLYGHLDSYAAGLLDGMPLERGQVIGYVGTTGNAPPGTPHLHFGVLRGDPAISWSKGAAINPYPIFMATL